MAADPVVICLKEVTDYAQFERLCSDLMTMEGYPSLEPLGGFKDKGRDAVHFCTVSGQATIFAYSVREDWRKKLEEDARKIRKHRHPCNKLVFLCNSAFAAGPRDKAIQFVKTQFGWELDLFGVERLGTLLRTKHRRLLGQHPQIFTPAFFPPIVAGIDPSVQDFVFIDHVDADSVLATWLARRLLGAGYRPWCKTLSILPGERVPKVMETVIRNHACKVLALYSQASLRDPHAQARRSAALNTARERGPGFFVPLTSGRIERGRLDYQTRDLEFIAFERGWAEGLRRLLATLEATGCPRPLPDGAALAARTLEIPGLVRESPESLLSNCFPVRRVPKVVHLHDATRPVNEEARHDLAVRWAFRPASPTRLMSFHRPVLDVAEAFGLSPAGHVYWMDAPSIDGISSHDLAMELVRKSLIIKCAERGLFRVAGSGLLAFPSGLLPRDRLTFRRPDGRMSFVLVAGERSIRRGGARVRYRYHLAPVFWVRADIDGAFTALLRIRLHLTDLQGRPLPRRVANSRRKKLCKSWWNNEWLARTLAVSSFLADGNGDIVIGSEEEEQVIVAAAPLTWEAPVGIDESILEPSAWDRDEVLPGREEGEEEAEGESHGHTTDVS